MKKRILALLLAGLLTASMVSCITTKPRPDGPGLGGGTEDQQTMDDTETDPVVTVTWISTDKTVYVTPASTTLTKVDDSTATVKVNQLTELHCIKISSDAKRCIVERDGVQYYVSADKVTDEDLLGKSFTECAPKTMYAKKAVNVRKFASDNNAYSTVIKTLKINDSVTVVAEGTNWSKIKVDENTFYFVYAEFLSDTEVKDPDNEDFSAYFTDLNPTVKLYVTAPSSLTVRVNASTESSPLTYLVTNAEVTALAQGTIEGIKWYKILVPDDIKEGQTQTYSIGYATDKYLSETKGSVSMTLDEMIEQYSFTKKETPQELYVSSDALFVRSTPAFPAANDNIVATLAKKDTVKVVAVGTVDDNNWAMIELDGKYCFVGYSKLTTDPNGTPMEVPLSFAELLSKYQFTECTEKTVYAKGTVKCNTSPTNQETAPKTLTAGNSVKVLATGTVSYVEWYLFQIEGDTNFYFAGASLFTDVAPVA